MALYRPATQLGAKLTNWIPSIGRPFNDLSEFLWQRSASETTVNTSNVILACGGFVYNQDLKLRYAPRYEHISPLGTVGDDGSGMALGIRAGGATEHLDRISAWRFLSPPSALLEGVTVGVNGDRIANEDLYGATLTHLMVQRFGGRGFLILDSAIWERGRSQVWDQTMIFQRIQMAWVFGLGHRKSPTLAGLAEKLGISSSGLMATVDAYNAAIAAQTDDPARKADQVRAPIKHGPHYGIDISVRPSSTFPVTGLTLGGLKVDEATGMLLTNNGSLIDGLYAAGRTAVGICSNSYISGLSLADCVFAGRRAGEHAAQRIQTSQR